MTKFKQIFCIVFCIIITLLAVGCSTKESTQEPPIPIRYDKPEAKRAEGEAVGSFTAKLYFLSSDQETLMQQQRVIELADGQGRVEAAIEALLEGPDAGSSLISVFQQDSKLLAVQVSGDIASVDIDYKGNRLDNREWLIARLMIADTVISADESIEYVNIYINGYEQGYYALPLGAATAYEGSIAQYIEQLRQKYGLEYQSGEANDIIATLYFTDETENLLLCEARSVDIEVGDEVENADYDVKHIKLLLEELISGSSGALRPVIPYDLRLEQMPQIETLLSQDGYDRNIITLHFNEPSEAYDQQFVCAAITLTVTGFYPEVEGVKIFFGDTEAQYAGVGAKMFRRSDFTQLIGNTVYINVPDTSENVFKSTHVSLPYGDTYLSKVRLDKLFEMLPEAYAAFTSADIKDIYVYDDTAVIDMTVGFTEKLRELPAPDGEGDIDYIESLLIYSIVNTVTELDGINKVWFLENGERILDGASLYLGNALLRSPGNIVSE